MVEAAMAEERAAATAAETVVGTAAAAETPAAETHQGGVPSGWVGAHQGAVPSGCGPIGWGPIKARRTVRHSNRHIVRDRLTFLFGERPLREETRVARRTEVGCRPLQLRELVLEQVPFAAASVGSVLVTRPTVDGGA